MVSLLHSAEEDICAILGTVFSPVFLSAFIENILVEQKQYWFWHPAQNGSDA
jgi:hypothetical protein